MCYSAGCRAHCRVIMTPVDMSQSTTRMIYLPKTRILCRSRHNLQYRSEISWVQHATGDGQGTDGPQGKMHRRANQDPHAEARGQGKAGTGKTKFLPLTGRFSPDKYR